MPQEKRKPEEPEAAKIPAVCIEVTQPSAPLQTQATSSEGASGSPERADKSDVHGTKAGAENANEEHDSRESSDGEEAKMKTQHRSLVTRDNQVKAGIEENINPVKEALKDSLNHDSQSPEATSKAVFSGDDVNDSLKSLTERSSAALVNISGKEDSVKQPSKVAEERVSTMEHENGELQAQLAAYIPAVIPLEECTTSLENHSLINTRSHELDMKDSEDVEAGGVGGDDEELEGDEVDVDAQDVEAGGVGGDDEELEGDEVDEEHVEHNYRSTFWVFYDMPLEPLLGYMFLDDYNEINEVDQEVWRIIFTHPFERNFWRRFP